MHLTLSERGTAVLGINPVDTDIEARSNVITPSYRLHRSDSATMTTLAMIVATMSVLL